MTKLLEQIQQENRRFIFEANYGTLKEARNNKSLPLEVRGDYSYLPLTLSRVLLALKSEIQTPFPIKENIFILLFVHKNGDITDIFWDLAKETIEGQSEETQRVINKLFFYHKRSKIIDCKKINETN